MEVVFLFHMVTTSTHHHTHRKGGHAQKDHLSQARSCRMAAKEVFEPVDQECRSSSQQQQRNVPKPSLITVELCSGPWSIYIRAVAE